MESPVRRVQTSTAWTDESNVISAWLQNYHSAMDQNTRLSVKRDSRGNLQLDLSNQGLIFIPQQVFQFQQLNVLKLSDNQLDQLPSVISYLRRLQTLLIQNNLLTTLPPTLVNCRHLVELDLTNNRIVILPQEIGELAKLRMLKLGNNQLEQIPHQIGSLNNLRILDLHSNRLWYLPFSIQNLYHLLCLDLSDNLFDQIPFCITKIIWLRILNISQNCLAALPPDFDQMHQLRELNLSENRFTALGIITTKLRQIKCFSMSHNCLQLLPDQVTQMKNLQVLHLKDNLLKVLPDAFPNLKYLNVSENKLEYMSVLHMAQLVSLNASGNKMEALPIGIYKLKYLERLNLARNQIKEISENICWLKKLQFLDLSENDLHIVPASLYSMEKLTCFNIQGNYHLSHSHRLQGDTLHRHRTSQTERDKLGPHGLFQKYSASSLSSMKNKSFSDWPQSQKSIPMHDENRLGKFCSKSNHYQNKPSLDENSNIRTVRSMPHSENNHDIWTRFSSDSESTINDKKFHFQGPFSSKSHQSQSSVPALEVSISSSDPQFLENNESRKNGEPWIQAYTTLNLKQKSQNSTFIHKSTDSVTAGNNDQRRKPFCCTDKNPRDHTKKKLTFSCAPCQSNYKCSKNATERSEPKHIGVLMTKASKSHCKVTNPSQETMPQMQNKVTQILTPEKNITPLTIHAWTQTVPRQENIPSDSPESVTNVQTGLYKQHSLEDNESSSSDGSILMFRQGTGNQNHQFNHEQHSPGKSDCLGTITSLPFNSAELYSGLSSSSGSIQALKLNQDSNTQEIDAINTNADYTLLSMCNQLQTLLYKDHPQPVTSFCRKRNTTRGGSSAEWVTGDVDAKTKQGTMLEAGLEYSPAEAFTITKRGDHYVSAFCPQVQISVPPGATNKTLHITLQVLTISHAVLKAISDADSCVSNIISTGPTIFFNTLENKIFTSPVTMTLPAPTAIKGQPGHLILVSIRPDNTCVPCTSTYELTQQKVTLTTWHLTG